MKRMFAKILAACMFVGAPSAYAQDNAPAREGRSPTVEDLALSPLPACTRAPPPRAFRQPAGDVAAQRAAAVDALTEKLIAYNDAHGSLRAAPGDVRVNVGEIAPGTIFLRAPVAYAAVGRLSADLVAAPAFSGRFTVFPAGAEVWRKRNVVFYDCTPHAATLWCGRRTGPDADNRPNLQCFIEPPASPQPTVVSSGIAQPHGPVFFPHGFTVFIEVADKVTPPVEIMDAIGAAPTLEYVFIFQGWRRSRPRIGAFVMSNGVAASTWDDIDMRRVPGGFAVQAWGGEILLSPGSNPDSAVVEAAAPVGPFSPEAIARLMRQKAELHVDAAIAAASARQR